MTCATDRARPPAEVQSEGGEGVAAPSTEAAGDEAIPIAGLPEIGTFWAQVGFNRPCAL
jgi:hypothetical protein